MALTKEQLMAPRYKIIAGWPLMEELDLEVGKIYPADGITGPDEQFLLKYPHLFQKLEWHDDRKPEEMPNYVRYGYFPYGEDDYCFVHVDGVELSHVWNNGEYFGLRYKNTKGGMFIGEKEPSFFPATEEEYNQYIQKQTTTP